MKENSKNFIGSFRPDAADSLRWSANYGYAEAPAALGRLYLEGRPESATDADAGKDLMVSSFTPALEQVLAQAAKWLRKAADQGHVEAKRLFGTVLAKPREFTSRIHWL